MTRHRVVRQDKQDIDFRYGFLGIFLVLVPMETNRVGHEGLVVVV